MPPSLRAAIEWSTCATGSSTNLAASSKGTGSGRAVWDTPAPDLMRLVVIGTVTAPTRPGHEGVGMRADLRLAWRFLRSGDRRAVIRTASTALGVALGVLACLAALAIPRALDAADARNAARTPFGDRTGAGLHYSSSVELLDGRPWTKVMVSGVTGSSPRPPGVSAWPATGRTMVSPGLARALAARSDGGLLVRNVILERIGAQGLRSPDEYLSYTMTADGGGSDVAIAAFGDPRARGQTVSAVMLAELLFVVGLPSVVFLATVLRLSFLSRRERSAALLRIGVSPRRAARMFAVEMAMVSGVGAVVGVGCYLVIEPWLGSSGVLGLAWFHATAVSTMVLTWRPWSSWPAPPRPSCTAPTSTESATCPA